MNDNNKRDRSMMNLCDTYDEGSNAINQQELTKEYRILSLDDIRTLRQQDIDKIVQLTGLSLSSSQIIGNYYKWNIDRLLETYYEAPDKVLIDAGVVVPEANHKKIKQSNDTINEPNLTRKSSRINNSVNIPPKNHDKPDPTASCLICWDSIEKDHHSAVTELSCGHYFCQDCWRNYFYEKIINQRDATRIKCPNASCTLSISDEFIYNMTTMTDSESSSQGDVNKLLDRLNELSLQYYVSCLNSMTWCPYPDCQYIAAAMPLASLSSVLCKCGNRFCVICNSVDHLPVHCEYLARWTMHCEKDSASYTWISTNSRECPKCKVRIEKNGGCNHMTCRAPACRFEFCWMCMGDWKSHKDNYKCNVYESSANKKALSNTASQRQIALDRYLFYFNRFINHKNAESFKEDLLKRLEFTISKMITDHHLQWLDKQAILKATMTLFACRATLKFTYPFAYYCKPNNQAIIFQNNQKDLEIYVEQLTRILEVEIFDISFEQSYIDSIKRRIIDLETLVEKRRLILLEHVERGYEENYWDFYSAAETDFF